MKPPRILLAALARVELQPLWRFLYKLSLAGLGFMNGDPRLNGEHRFLRDCARRWARDRLEHPVVIDAGASAGDFTAAVLEQAPGARVIAVEAMPGSAERLRRRFEGHDGVEVLALALADHGGPTEIFDACGDGDSPHASLLPESFTHIYPGSSRSLEVPGARLDDLVAERGLGRIDLLKLDVEGAERAVLEGAAEALGKGRIEAVLMEFNAHNLVSGLSLLKLTRLLPGFDIYRLVANGRVPLVTDQLAYHPREEIYRYCNLAALRRGPDARGG